MQCVNIGTLYNLDDQAVTINAPGAVGLAVISAVFPRGVTIAADGGNVSTIPLLRGQKLWLPTTSSYKITYPDTFAGNLETSSWGNWNTFEPENPETLEQNALGNLRAMIFYNKEEYDAYTLDRLEDVLFVPLLEGLDSLSELYSLHNLDFDVCTLQVRNASNGYYNCFRIEEGNETNPGTLDGFAQLNRTILGYLTAPYLTAANEAASGYCVITGVHSIRVLQISSDVTAGSQRCYLYARFHSGQGVSGVSKRGGRNAIRAVYTIPNGTTVNFDVASLGQVSWTLVLLNSGANALTTSAIRLMYAPDSNTVIDPASNVIASGAHAAAVVRSAVGVTHNGADIIRITANAAAGDGEITLAMCGFI